VCLGHEMSLHNFSCLGGAGADSAKSASEHVTLNLCFASGEIYGSCSEFLRIRGTICGHIIFHARVRSVRIP
jgi:hypothetical protein